MPTTAQLAESTIPANGPAGRDRARPAFTVGGDPVCVARSGGSLVVADGCSGALVLVSPEGDQHRRLATVDSSGVLGACRVGGLVVTPDGMVFASRVGEGQVGAILAFDALGRGAALPEVPVKVWQGALAFGNDRLYATQYLRSRNGAFDGVVVEVDRVTGTCSNVIDGFLHPTGLAVLGNVLVVADARRRAVFRIDLAGGRGVLRLQLTADIERPEAVCACGDRAVLVTSIEDETGIGAVRRLGLDGTTEVIAQGPWEPRGVCSADGLAYVATRRHGILTFAL